MLYGDSGYPTYDDYVSLAKLYVQFYVTDRGQPLRMGEWGEQQGNTPKGATFWDNPSPVYTPDWKTRIPQLRDILLSLPLCGYQWHCYPVLFGGTMAHFDQTDSNTILSIVGGGSAP